MDQARAAFVQARVAASSRKGTLPAWPRDEKDFPLVEIEVDWVRFSTLNHRTKAEQMREIARSGNANLFSSDPLGIPAQSAQYQILKDAPGFEALKQDLKDRGQREPAVITAEGVLINGNRRAAALRSRRHDDQDLNAAYVKCLVLPADATPSELLQLETELQVAQDFKEQYSWINQALLIEELYIQHGRNFDLVAKMVHRDVKPVREDYEKLQQVNQLVDLSGRKRMHVDFEPNESAFDELAQHIRNKTDSERDAVRNVYFLGTLAGVNYRDLRNLRRGDCVDLVQAELRRDIHLQEVLQQSSSTVSAPSSDDDLLDGVLGEAAPRDDVASLLGFVAKNDPETPVQFKDGTSVEVADLAAQIARAVTKAADEAAEQQKDINAVSAPIARLDQALQYIQRARDTVTKARALPGWNEAKFEGLVVKIEDVVKELKRTAE